MGLMFDESGSKSTFSSDVLRIEMIDPNQEHLSVIDVFGIFKRTTLGVTTKTNIEMVEGMIHNYMKNAWRIMLVVVSTNVDIAIQEILERAEELDSKRTRTLRVLTKSNLVDKGAKKNIIDLIEGRTHQLKLDWHMLCNVGQAELHKLVIERQALEKSFFQKTP